MVSEQEPQVTPQLNHPTHSKAIIFLLETSRSQESQNAITKTVVKMLNKSIAHPLHDYGFKTIAIWHITNHYPDLLTNSETITAFHGPASYIADSIDLILTPTSIKGQTLLADWQPPIIVLYREDKQLILSEIDLPTLASLEISNPLIKTHKYDLLSLFQDNDFRREFQNSSHAAGSTRSRLVNMRFRKLYADTLKSNLKKLPTGMEHHREHEQLTKYIFDYFLDDCNGTGKLQQVVSNKRSKTKKPRLDVCYNVTQYPGDFWKKIRASTKASHLIVECKNSNRTNELNTSIAQMKKYFNTTRTGRLGIVAIRSKRNLNKNDNYRRLISSKNTFLLVLDDSDIHSLLGERIHCLEKSRNSIIIHHASSGGILQEMMNEARIIY